METYRSDMEKSPSCKKKSKSLGASWSLNPTYENIYNEDLGKYVTGITPFQTTREQASTILSTSTTQSSVHSHKIHSHVTRSNKDPPTDRRRNGLESFGILKKIFKIVRWARNTNKKKPSAARLVPPPNLPRRRTPR